MDDEAKNLGIAAAELQPARCVTFCLLHIYACFYSVPNYRSARVCLISFFITGQTDRRHVSSPPSFGVHDFREMSKYFGMALGGVLHRLCVYRLFRILFARGFSWRSCRKDICFAKSKG